MHNPSSRGVMSAQSWFAPAVWFAAFTGARRGETLAMRWSDLNLDEAGATICRSLTQTDDVQRSTRSPSLRRNDAYVRST